MSNDMSETITLSRADEQGTETMTITRNGNEVRIVSTTDGTVTDDRIAYDGYDAGSWLRARLIDWQSDGYQEV